MTKIKDFLSNLTLKREIQQQMQEPIIKKQMQTFVEYLCNLCLENAETYHNYDDTDLFNATEVFMHFLMDKIYSENQKLPQEEMEKLATTVGKSVRELIKAATGKDMHEVVKKMFIGNELTK